MAQNIIYGDGGYCENCDPELHGHPMHNLVSIEELPDFTPEPVPETTQLAEVLSTLPQETLDALKSALGI